MVIRIYDAKRIAEALHERYKPIRAVTLIGSNLEKNLFTGRSDEVILWACVFAHYRGGNLSANSKSELAKFRKFILPDIDEI